MRCQRHIVVAFRKNLIMETMGDRIRKLREARGIEPRMFARSVGMAYSTLMDLENGYSKSTRRLHAIIAALGTTAEYLERGRGVPDCDTSGSAVVDSETEGQYVRVEQSGEAGMGDGRENEDYPDVIHTVEYSHGFIRDLIGFLPPAGRLKLTTGRGDSMMPTIQPGDAVLYDSGVSRFDGDGIYLVNLGHGQQIKRLRDSGDVIYVVSDNTAYAPIPFPKNAFIAGKVYLKNKIERFA